MTKPAQALVSSLQSAPSFVSYRSLSFSSALRSLRCSVPHWSHCVDWRSLVSLRASIRTAAPILERFERKIATTGCGLEAHNNTGMEPLTQVHVLRPSFSSCSTAGYLLSFSSSTAASLLQLIHHPLPPGPGYEGNGGGFHPDRAPSMQLLRNEHI